LCSTLLRSLVEFLEFFLISTDSSSVQAAAPGPCTLYR